LDGETAQKVSTRLEKSQKDTEERKVSPACSHNEKDLCLLTAAGMTLFLKFPVSFQAVFTVPQCCAAQDGWQAGTACYLSMNPGGSAEETVRVMVRA
jgi:hypothetical protein